MCHLLNGISQCYPIFTADTFSILRFSTITMNMSVGAIFFQAWRDFYLVDVSLSKGICVQEAVI